LEQLAFHKAAAKEVVLLVYSKAGTGAGRGIFLVWWEAWHHLMERGDRDKAGQNLAHRKKKQLRQDLG